MKKLLNLILILLLLVSPIASVNAESLGQRLAGKLLLQVQDHGRIWYVSTNDFKRYEVTFKNALPLFEKLALGINNRDLERIDFDKSFARRLHGKLLLQVQDKGRIWYVDFSGNRHEVTWENLLPLFESLSLGITNTNLSLIPKGFLSEVSVIEQPEQQQENSAENQETSENNSETPDDPTMGSNNFTGKLANSSLHNFVNNYRTDLGLNALILHEGLCGLVDERIEEVKLDFSHAGFEARFETDELNFLKYRSIGENLFMANFGDENTAIDGWHNSPGHRENMRGEWTHACSKLVDGYGVSLFLTLQ